MEITAIANQAVLANNNILFTETVIPGNCSIHHRPDSGIVTLKGMASTQSRARFRVTFNGNIGVTETPEAISIAIAIDGEPVGSSVMTVVPAAAEEYWNVASSIFIDVPKCCCYTVSVENTTNRTINVQNANLIVERVA